MSKPDFLVIGAMKCGTSTLAAQLGYQDGIFLTTPKEPNFFSDDDVFARGLPWYSALFDAAQRGDLKGEASTHYTKIPTHPDTLSRMTAVLDAPRLVYVVRDPVQRAVSHFMHEWTERRMSGDFQDAIATYPELVEYSLYAKQIAPFIDAYGLDAICLTSLERIKADPQHELERVATHTGLTHKPIWKTDLAAQNVSGERTRKLPFHSLLVGNPISRALRRTLIPQSVRTKVSQARRFGDRPTVSPGLKTELRARFAFDQARLAQLFPGIIDIETKKDVS
jgi:hypothetical protein